MIKEWIKAFKELPTTEDRRRSEICKTCDFAKESKYLEFINGQIEDVKGLYCNQCKCPLISKIKTTNPKHVCKKWL